MKVPSSHPHVSPIYEIGTKSAGLADEHLTSSGEFFTVSSIWMNALRTLCAQDEEGNGLGQRGVPQCENRAKLHD
jgi:hypothetical protein